MIGGFCIFLTGWRLSLRTFPIRRILKTASRLWSGGEIMSTPDTMSGVQAAAGCVRRRNVQCAGGNCHTDWKRLTAFRGSSEANIDGFDKSNPYEQGELEWDFWGIFYINCFHKERI